MSEQQTNSETVGFRLSPQQELSLGSAEQAVVQCAIELGAGAGPTEVAAALQAAGARPEILRTTFPLAEGMRSRTQVIQDDLVVDCRAAGDGELAGLLDAESARVFDLDRGPLMRALVLENSGRVILTAHAACADEASLERIGDELPASAGGADPVRRLRRVAP